MQVLSPDLRVSEDFRVHFRSNGFVLLHGVLTRGIVEGMEFVARDLVAQQGVSIRNENDGHVLSYTVVTGDVIRQAFGELFAFYNAPDLRDWIGQITGAEQVHLSRNLRSAVNINCMREAGQIYRWHFDAVPYTAVLFLTTSAPADGGALEIAVHNIDHEKLVPLKGAEFSIMPQAGGLLLMDGTRCLHRAAPLLRDALRLTVPMVYPVIPDDSRPERLDQYLYEGGGSDQRPSGS